MTIEIQKNIPVPTRKKLPRYPLADMEVGDSFLSGVGSEDKNQVQTLRTTIWRLQSAMDGKRFSVVKDAEKPEMRVFRVE